MKQLKQFVRRGVVGGLVGGVVVLSSLARGGEDVLPEPDPAITAREIAHHVAFLASDELMGRKMGTEHSRRAARYLARALERAGLQPGGDAGEDGAERSFLQAVPLVRVTHKGVPQLTVVDMNGVTLECVYGQDFTVAIQGMPSSTAALELTLAASADAIPESADGEQGLVLFGSTRERRDWLAERDMKSGAGWGLLVTAKSDRQGKPSDKLPRGYFRRRPDSDLCDGVALRGPLAQRLKDGELATLQLTYDVEIEEIPDYNVIGILPGVGTQAHPELAKEAIVLSAHYDHIGTVTPRASTPADADLINNGADDDASGTAAVLELAEAFAHGKPPARTLVFLLAAGEESGMVGTYYYIDHPAVPLADTKANLNFEMLGRPDPLVGGIGKLWLSGFERTTLGPAFREKGLDVVADKRLEQNFFMRSDNIAFVKQGIVGQTLSTYNLHKDYHRVTDEADTLNYEHMEACVRAGYFASQMLADGRVTPEWLEGGLPEFRSR